MIKNKGKYITWLIALFFLFFASWQLISNFYDQQVLSQHEDFLQQKTSSFIRLTKNENEDFTQTALDYVKDSDERITQLTKTGEIIFDTFDTELSGSRSRRPEVKAVLEGNVSGQSVRRSSTLEQEVLYIAIPVKENGEITQIIRMAEPTKNFLPAANQMKQAIFWVNFVFWLILTLIILSILRRQNRPVETILPVIKQMIKEPEQQKKILQNSPGWQELYQSINTLSKQMSDTYYAFTTSERQFYTLLNDLIVGVFIIDETGNVIFINETLAQQLNINAQKINQPFTAVITDPQFIQIIYQTHDAKLINKKIRTTDTKYLLDVTIRLFQDTGYIFGISYDMTRISELEKLQNDFIGNVSHELKTPVTSLIGFTETLLDGAKDDPEVLKSFLEIMQKDAYRLQDLVQEIIESSKSSDSNDIITPINLANLLEKIVGDYHIIIQEKNLQLSINGPKDLTFNSKVELFTAICKNLIENAVHYTSSQGKINIRFYKEDNELILSVEDTGIGISQQEQERIFERFYRIDKARARNSGGNGLGLAIVKDYSEILGGQVKIDSYPGLGSTFTVYLPFL
ncbi:two-component histidine kinase [Tetragenococcus halophilus subsp. halophilus]|uniref:sensor histidine kinase n=1 Tax=Tetragenococcus halophilus TaxID=51669 RepID=UPI000CAF7731|nr:ATP-binding protein [Tetragenococcus halophilus]GBD79030.1 two-component histidine kinase [Tetragenococcus halophilus subsp. halophilus]GBD82923.1 two-component histidine kinase [Tetragenococcus halophilus subsp. halophilus]